MDNPVDHPIDLGFVNYVRHPSNKDYIVYRFSDVKRADAFRIELQTQKIWFEEDTEMKRETRVYLFGVHKTDFNKTQKINYKVEGAHKKPVIPFKAVRIGLLVFFFAVVAMASIGYCKRQDTLQRINETARIGNSTQSVH